MFDEPTIEDKEVEAFIFSIEDEYYASKAKMKQLSKVNRNTENAETLLKEAQAMNKKNKKIFEKFDRYNRENKQAILEWSKIKKLRYLDRMLRNKIKDIIAERRLSPIEEVYEPSLQPIIEGKDGEEEEEYGKGIQQHKYNQYNNRIIQLHNGINDTKNAIRRLKSNVYKSVEGVNENEINNAQTILKKYKKMAALKAVNPPMNKLHKQLLKYLEELTMLTKTKGKTIDKNLGFLYTEMPTKKNNKKENLPTTAKDILPQSSHGCGINNHFSRVP